MVLPGDVAALVAALAPACLVVVRDGVEASLSGSDPEVGVTFASAGAIGLPAPEAPQERSAATGDAFEQLNQAFSTPLGITVGPGARPRGPVVVVHWLAADKAASFPSTRIEAGEQAEVSVVEIVASADVASLCVPVTEIAAGDGSRVDYLALQQLGDRVWQLGTQSSSVGRDATLTSTAIALGGDFARLRTESSLRGKGAAARLYGMYFAAGRRMVDFRTTQEHREARTSSDLLYKGAVANQSRAVYSGLIRVEKGARGTNAFQTNRNLVLHEGARADSVPNLEIEDNDVRASHASAVGPIAADQRFYLESKGVPADIADRLITLGFLDEVLAHVRVAAAADHLRLRLVGLLADAEAAEKEGRP